MTTETASEVVDEAAQAPTSAIAEYNPTAAALHGLRMRLQGVVWDVATTKGMEAAKAARFQLVKLRTSLEEKRKELKAPALERSRLIDAEAARIKGEVAALEDPIDQQIKAEEKRKEDEKAAKVSAEAQRKSAIQARIAQMSAVVVRAAGAPSADIAAKIDLVSAISIDDSFAEFKDQAQATKIEAMGQLSTMHISAVAAEEAAAKVAQERADLERQRREQEEANRVERERLAEEKRQQDARASADRERAEQEQRAQRERAAEEDRATRARQKKLDDEAAAARAEQDRIADAERQRVQAAMSQIQGIQQQVIIAQSGRLGVRIGGTRQCIVDTLAETLGWRVNEEEFGDFAGLAQTAKDAAVTKIQALLKDWDDRAAVEAARVESERLESERKAEQARKDEEERAARLRQEEAAAAADKLLRDSAGVLLDACRIAVVALAAATQQNPAFQKDYEAVDAAIRAATGMGSSE